MSQCHPTALFIKFLLKQIDSLFQSGTSLSAAVCRWLQKPCWLLSRGKAPKCISSACHRIVISCHAVAKSVLSPLEFCINLEGEHTFFMKRDREWKTEVAFGADVSTWLEWQKCSCTASQSCCFHLANKWQQSQLLFTGPACRQVTEVLSAVNPPSQFFCSVVHVHPVPCLFMLYNASQNRLNLQFALCFQG